MIISADVQIIASYDVWAADGKLRSHLGLPNLQFYHSPISNVAS